ncbi:hypothetical protein GCM10007416_05350 [Kroppenstedtia guangzhouensis]|uniref:Uncharacterized protein n=1 Tax=Kroppenstedtia guangzhouensis TaxID=1274356 RepID=A0ABQ1G1A5_9BACL|nr:hypothetical protein GCM10007416_05350 [Kroppenstedtia guangzhouensis]
MYIPKKFDHSPCLKAGDSWVSFLQSGEIDQAQTVSPTAINFNPSSKMFDIV